MSKMVFEYKKWDEFCRRMHNSDIISIPANKVTENLERYVVFKHDVETNVPRALMLATIEHKYGHCGSYYVQAYLMKNQKNIDILKQIQAMGHEVSYHYDVMDSNKGNIDEAIVEFEENRVLFEKNGFQIITVCQHGNPIVNRVGYTSNRDFFRSKKVQSLYPDVADIMVNYKDKFHTDYLYYSDVGRVFGLIFDPINGDRTNRDGKSITFNNLDDLFLEIKNRDHVFISTHPHRWTKSRLEYSFELFRFNVIKGVAKIFLNIPGVRRLVSRYYFLAKKI